MSIWIRKYAKRYLRQKFFLLLVFAMPVGVFWFAYLAHQDQTCVRVGIVNEQRNLFGTNIGRGLLQHQGIMQFCPMSSEEKMKQAIRQGELECGYLFPAEMEEKYRQHQYTGVVSEYYRKGSLFHTIAREIVLTGIFRQYGETMVDEYIRHSGLFRVEQMPANEVVEQYQENLKKQETFSFLFNDRTKVQNKLGDYLVAPIRGMISLLIMLAGFCGLSLYREDQRRELPAALPGTVSRYLPMISIMIPVFLVTMAGIVSEALCGFGFLSLKEIAYMLIYDIIVVLFCSLLSFTGIQQGALWVFALGYVCASAVFTPVFINLSAFIPGVQGLSYLCLPYYFLNAVFGGVREMVFMLLILVLFLAVTYVRFCTQRRFAGKDDYKL